MESALSDVWLPSELLPLLTLHFPSYSEQFAKCLHSNAGSIQLKQGGQSLSPLPRFSRYHGAGDCLALGWNGCGRRSVLYMEKSKSSTRLSCPAATATRASVAAKLSSPTNSRILEASNKLRKCKTSDSYRGAK